MILFLHCWIKCQTCTAPCWAVALCLIDRYESGFSSLATCVFLWENANKHISQNLKLLVNSFCANIPDVGFWLFQVVEIPPHHPVFFCFFLSLCRCWRVCNWIQRRLCPWVHEHPRELQVHMLWWIPLGTWRTQLSRWVCDMWGRVLNVFFPLSVLQLG